MTGTLAYARYELLRTFRNRRLYILSIAFPLVLYSVIAAPNRHEHSLGSTGISAPVYFMVGLALLLRRIGGHSDDDDESFHG